MKKTITIGPLYRAVDIGARAEEAGQTRKIELSFSSEDPYRRWFGYEILGHQPGEVDLSRVVSGRAPFLKDHRNSVDSVIGRVERAWLEGDKARAVVSISETPEGDAILARIRSGDLSSVSVGYRVEEMSLVRTEGDDDYFRVTKWMPYEISLVAVPADDTVGVGRSGHDDHRSFTFHKQEVGNMLDDNKPEATVADPNSAARIAELQAENNRLNAETSDRQREAATAAEAARVAEITALAAQFNAPASVRDDAISKNRTVAEFKGVLFDRDHDGAGDVMGRANSINLSVRDAEGFSFSRLICAIGQPHDRPAQEAARFELECVDEAARVVGRGTGNGVVIPYNVLNPRGVRSMGMTRASLIAGTGNLGGVTVETGVAGGYIDFLRKRSFVIGRARPLTGLTGNFDMPRKDTEGAATWIAENADLTEVGITLGALEFRPHDIGGYTHISRRLLMQSSVDVDMMVRETLFSSIATGADIAALYGAGGNAITGIYEISGIGATEFVGAVPTRAELLAMESAVGTANADVGALAFAIDSSMRGSLKGTAVDSGSGKFLYDDDGEIIGYPTEVSNIVADGDVVFGNWSDSIVGMWGTIELMVDPYSFARSRKVEVSAIQTMDFHVQHVGSFCASREAAE